MLQATAWCLPLSLPAPCPERGKKGTFVTAICSPASRAGGGETASILTLCQLTQSPSMAAALGAGLPARPWSPRGNTAQHRHSAPSSPCCSKGTELALPREPSAFLCPVPAATGTAGTAPAQQANLLWPLQQGQALPHRALQPLCRQQALRMHLEQT